MAARKRSIVGIWVLAAGIVSLVAVISVTLLRSRHPSNPSSPSPREPLTPVAPSQGVPGNTRSLGRPQPLGHAKPPRPTATTESKSATANKGLDASVTTSTPTKPTRGPTHVLAPAVVPKGILDEPNTLVREQRLAEHRLRVGRARVAMLRHRRRLLRATLHKAEATSHVDSGSAVGSSRSLNAADLRAELARLEAALAQAREDYDHAKARLSGRQ